MAEGSNSNTHPTPQLEASMSQLSLNSSASEDWDRSTSDIRVEPDPPKTPSPARVRDGNDDNEGTPSGARGRKSLTDLLRLHAENGKDLQLSEEDEQRLSEELGRWVRSDTLISLYVPYEPFVLQINSDSSPYEPDDDFFSRPSRDDSSLNMSKSEKTPVEVTTRPRGLSESTLGKTDSTGEKP